MRLLLQLKGVWRDLGRYVALVLVIVALLGVLYAFQKTNQSVIEETQCSVQVRQHAALKKLTGQQFESRIKGCGPEQVEIQDLEKANKKIADEMAQCWSEFGRGKLNLFEGDHLFCNVCSVVRFEDRGERVTGFSRFLRENNIPNREISYIDWLTLASSENSVEVDSLEENQDELKNQRQNYLDQEHLSTDKKYAVTFLYAKGQDSLRTIRNHLIGKTTEGKVGGTFALTGIAMAGGTKLVSVALGALGLSNPFGWVVYAGSALAVGGEVISYLYSDEAAHEWVSTMVLTEMNESTLDRLNCDYDPVE